MGSASTDVNSVELLDWFAMVSIAGTISGASMSTSAKLAAKRRTAEGSLQCRKLRRGGEIPGNLYGHKQDAVMLQFNAIALLAVIKTGIRLVDVEFDGNSEKALMREVQWSSMGDFITHVDLQRVDPNERLTVEVHVELKGTPPGVLSGGILEHSLRSLLVECPVIAIPDQIVIRIGEMEMGQAIHVREVEAPENVKILNSPEAIVVRIAAPASAVDTAADGGPAQPEVIGRKPDGKEEEEKK